MTTPESPPPRRSPSGFATARQAEALRRIEVTLDAASQALPVRLFFPAEGAADDVVAHFSYTQDEEGWTAFGDVARGAQGLVIARLEITPAAASSGVTGSLLRKIPIGELLAAVRLNAAWEIARREGTRELLGEEPAPGLFGETDEKAPRRGGRAPITNELLRDIAIAYLEETAPGQPSGAMKRMAARFGRPEETLRTWVTRARKDGWLGPSAKGRSGAEPGPRLVLYRIEAEGPGGSPKP